MLPLKKSGKDWQAYTLAKIWYALFNSKLFLLIATSLSSSPPTLAKWILNKKNGY